MWWAELPYLPSPLFPPSVEAARVYLMELYGLLEYLCASPGVIFVSCFIGRRMCEPAEGQQRLSAPVGLRLASEPGLLPFPAWLTPHQPSQGQCPGTVAAFFSKSTSMGSQGPQWCPDTVARNLGTFLGFRHWPPDIFRGDLSFCSLLGCVRLFATPWTIAPQALLFTEFPRQEYRGGLSFLLQGIFPTQGLNPSLLH